MILVTGGTGFLGTHLLDGLLEKRHVAPVRTDVHPGGPKGEENIKIRALRRKDSKILPRFVNNNIEWVTADVLDIIALEDAMEGIEKVYHCAAKVSFISRDHETMRQTNIKGTENIVNVALDKGVKKLLHVSSVAAIGRTGTDETITEKNKWENSRLNSVYALSKYLAEREVWRAMQEGLNAVIVNPSVIIGAGNWKQGTGRFFYTSQNGMGFYPRGVNGFVYVKDVVNCMIQLMESDISGERFIINSENYSYKDFFTEITRQFGVRQPGIEVKPWMTELVWRGSSLLSTLFGIYPLLTKETANNANNAYYYNNEKIRNAINYSFLPIKETVKLTVEEFKTDNAKH